MSLHPLIIRPLAPIKEPITSGNAGGAMPILHLQLHIWINDALMVLFFLMVGLELRREITQGELNSLARLAAPGLAALGGMVAPALIFLAFNYQTPPPCAAGLSPSPPTLPLPSPSPASSVPVSP